MSKIFNFNKLLLVSLLFLLLSQSVFAQSSCGNIVSEWWNWVHGNGSFPEGQIVTPITNCGNPFAADFMSDVNYPHTITINGQRVVQGNTIYVPIGGYNENFVIESQVFTDNFNNVSIEIFRHEEGGYKNVFLLEEPYIEFKAGTYTLVSSEGFLTVNKSDYIHKFFARLFPIANAQELLTNIRRTITFTVVEGDPGASNVLFLPGLMGSRLFEGETQRWEGGDTHAQRLYLNSEGKSINSIEAKEVIDTFDGFLNVDIYKSFLADLENYKNNNQINDYQAVPYDWRLSFSDILSDGVIENTLRSLASSSPTGRVSIVAHSNGGLLAKYLLSDLGDEAVALVDKLVMVGTPQLGTPKAIGALLHGYKAGIPFSLSSTRARDIARNMPGMYQLLPFNNYYTGLGSSISTPYVTFDDGSTTQAFTDNFGFAITSDELHDFLAGTEGRLQPAYSNLKLPAVGNSRLIQEAQLAQDIISSWQPPQGIEVHQIAGVGEPTLAGIDYKNVSSCNTFSPLVNHQTKVFCSDTLSYKPRIVYDGDGTVVIPSALTMGESDQSVKRWWVDLNSFNEGLGSNFLSVDHKNLLETGSLRSLVFGNILFKSSQLVPQYISNIQPSLPKDNRLYFTLHSPLHLSAVDEDGNEVAENISEISGAWYESFGEVQMLSIPKNHNFTVYLKGYDEGSFTLEIEEYENDTQVNYSVFSGIPNTANTMASINFSEGTLATASDLIIDYDGDGAIDLELTVSLSETVSLPRVDEELESPEIKKRPSSSGYFSRLEEDDDSEEDVNILYIELLKLIIKLLELRLSLFVSN